MKKLNVIVALIFMSILFINKNVQAEATSGELISNLEGQTFEIDSAYDSYEDENGDEKFVYYYDKIDDTVHNSNGEKVDGYYTYSKNRPNPIFGYNYITYTFHPSSINKDGKLYNDISGSFIVINNKIPKIKTFSNRITIYVYVNKYRIEVDGESYNQTTIKNLQADKEYEIKIYQKKTKNFEETLLYTTTVKTKSK